VSPPPDWTSTVKYPVSELAAALSEFEDVGAVLAWSLTAMSGALRRLAAASAADIPQAVAAATEAVWWVTLVDAAMTRCHPGAYGTALDPAARRAVEGSFAGLRFIRGQLGYADPGDFIQPQPAPGGGNASPSGWTWAPLPPPPPHRGTAREASPYREYRAYLAGQPLGQALARAAGFLSQAHATAADDHGGMEVTAADLAGLTRAAVASHARMRASASRMTDEDCRAPSLLPGWSRGHVLAHWARNADGQTRMLSAAMRGEVAAQYPGGDAQRAADIETGAVRPARLILDDAHAAVDRVEEVWRRMPPEAWSRSTGARIGQRPAWKSVWARWRETEIHHVDLDAGYTHGDWPGEFVRLMLPRVLPTLDARLADEAAVRVETADGQWTRTWTAAAASGDVVVVRGAASAVLCWLAGRPVPAAADLAVSRCGQPCPLPRLRPWS
jgi:maleylpyruvate isomerase